MLADRVPTYAGGRLALATAQTVGEVDGSRPDVYVPGAEELADGDIRVSILGSGQPWVTKSQAAGSVLMEIGNPARDVFVFDLGAGSLANFSALKVPVTSLTKVFLSHLHADHIADYVTLMGSYVKAGRLDPVEVWGGDSNEPAWGIEAFVEAIDKALAWDIASIRGYRPTSGAAVTATAVPFDRTEVVYERNGVRITSFPVIHALNGAVGYRLDYGDLSVVFSGDTTPTTTLVDVAEGCDLLVHETFLPAAVFAQLTGMPIEQAKAVVNTAHTPADAAGVVFEMVQPRMAGMWHCHVIDGYIEPVFEDMRKTYAGAATLCQDLTVFDVSSRAVSVRQASVDAVAQPVLGPSRTEPRLEKPHPRPAWWNEASIDWASKVGNRATA